MSDQKETADEIVERYEREAEELRAKAQDELKEVAAAERAEGLADRKLRREQLSGAWLMGSGSVSEVVRKEMENWSGEESWLWAREEFLADGWNESQDENGNIWWKRDPEDK